VAIGSDRAVLGQLHALFNVGAIRELSDGQLLERFATSPRESAELAFAVLVERHGAMVLRVCRGVLIDPHDTQDAFQATFLVLVKKARALWVRDSLGPWLHQVAYRTAMCARLNAARRRRHELRAAESFVGPRVESSDEPTQALHEEIGRLPERFRAPVVLCDLEGRTHEQAARSLKWPIGTVKSRLSRARERLRDRLSRRGLTPNSGLLASILRSPDANSFIPPRLVDSTTRAVVQFALDRTIVPGAVASLTEGVLKTMSIARLVKSVAILLVLGASASGVDLLVQDGKPGADASREKWPSTVRVDGPRVAVVEPGKILVTLIDRGRVEPSNSNDVFCRVDGGSQIIWLLPEGSRVQQNDLVVELDSAELRDRHTTQMIATRKAEQEFRYAKRILDATAKYVKQLEEPAPGDVQDFLNQLEADVPAKEQTYQLELAKSDRLKVQISNCKIFSPATGAVVYANRPNPGAAPPLIELGAKVRERQKIFSVPDLDHLQVVAKLPEAWIDQVRICALARIKPDAFAQETLTGVVKTVNGMPDATKAFGFGKNVYTTTIALDAPHPLLLSGMTVDVEIMIAERDNVLRVPVSAVISRDGKIQVAVKNADGAVVWREVTLGLTNGKQVEIQKGLQKGEKVIVYPERLANDEPARSTKTRE
jgi:RND family efflux transporter MFP subunit